ncbi:autotransporter-associated beta strand repeat-containing protein [Methylomonas sp. HYX-M1]|uniref:autotransporter-associated beta strand repeat-containing protein n=1 Tax=Methylomonas sp. HYX-M1 TaxID=3139307 RepID=UPI00345B7D03
MKNANSLSALVGAIAMILGGSAPVGATVVLGGTGLVIDSPAVIGDSALAILPSGLGNTGSLFFQNSMVLTNPISIFSGATANFQTFAPTVELSGEISGAGALSKQLAGTLILSGTNSYSGGTTVNAGTIAVTNDVALGSGAVKLAGGTLRALATTNLNNAFELTGSNLIAAAAGTTLTLDNIQTIAQAAQTRIGMAGADGTVILAASPTINSELLRTTNVDVSAGSLKLGNAPAGALLSNLSVQAKAAVELNGYDLVSSLSGGTGHISNSGSKAIFAVAGGNFAGKISGNLQLDAVAGDTILSGEIRPDQGTVIDDGATLTLQGEGTLTGAIENNGAFVIDTPFDIRLDAPITGTGSVNKQNSSFLTLNAVNTFSGGLDVEGGAINLKPGATPGSGQISLRSAEFHTFSDTTLTNRLFVAGTSVITAAHGTILRWNPADVHGEQPGYTLRFGDRLADGTINFGFTDVDVVDVVAGTVRASAASVQHHQINQLNIEAQGIFDLGGKSAHIAQLTGEGAIENSGPFTTLLIGTGEFAGRMKGEFGVNFANSLVLNHADIDIWQVKLIDSNSVAMDGGALTVHDMDIQTRFIQGPDSTVTIKNLRVDAAESKNVGQYFQLGGETQINDRFELGVGKRGLYVLQEGTLSLNAGKVVVGNSANAQFDWRGGRLRFLDDYTLTAGAPLLPRSLALDNTQTLQARNLTLAADARVQLDGSTLNADQTLRNAGTIVGKGTLRADTLVNEGRIEFLASHSEVHADLNNTQGQISLADKSAVTFFDGVENNGTFNVELGATATFKGRVSGLGEFSGDGKSIYEAEFHVGNRQTFLNLDGTHVFETTSIIDFDISGPSSDRCSDCYAPLIFNDSVFFNKNTLKVNLIEGYVPHAGDRFMLFAFNGTHIGQFGEVVLPELFGKLAWDTSRLETFGELKVSGVPLPSSVWMFITSVILVIRTQGRRCGEARTASFA